MEELGDELKLLKNARDQHEQKAAALYDSLRENRTDKLLEEVEFW